MRVLIVGCGNIAGVFDQGRPASDFPLTHAGAYVQDRRFALTACVEPDDTRRSEFMNAWRVPSGFRSIEDALESRIGFDVVSICSPTSSHAHDLDAVLGARPKLIFCEKPVTPTFSETARVVSECARVGIPLAVNYTRRWAPDVARLQVDIQEQKWGQLRSVIGLYNKGILNNGSHMLDLLHLLIGSIDVIQVGKPVYDFFPDDPTIPALLEGPQQVPVTLACGHSDDYAIFELQLVFSQGVITMEAGGMFWRERRAIASDTFKGYRVLEEGASRAGEYPRAMAQAIDNVYLAASRGDTLASTGVTALAAQRICEQIRRQACAPH